MADDGDRAGPSMDPLDAQIFAAEGGLRPDHPLLRRAQEALKAQFLATRTRLQDELREKANALKVREGVAVPSLLATSCKRWSPWPGQ